VPAQKVLISVCGPTAAGKTALAIELAKHFQTEIISADSRQFYREMEIGTAKPSLEELAAVPHHFVNSHSVNENFSVADFEKVALAELALLFQNHDVVLMAGGSGLYLQAIYQGFDEMPDVRPQERMHWNQVYRELGLEYLQNQLKISDPEYYAKVDLQNAQRIIRALEVSTSTGKPFSSFLTKSKKERDFKVIKIGINPERTMLYNRINKRVEEMVKNGLVEEAQSLSPYQHLNALNTVGYKELFDAFNRNTPVKEAIELIKQNTRRFAKRQITWFKKDPEVLWFDSPDVNTILPVLKPLIS
jgi:tRNA dimethylallyltransferase